MLCVGSELLFSVSEVSFILLAPWNIKWTLRKDLQVFKLHHLTASIVYFKCWYRLLQAQDVVSPTISRAVQPHSNTCNSLCNTEWVLEKNPGGASTTSLVMCTWDMDEKGNYMLTLGLCLSLWTAKSLCSFLGYPFKMPAEMNIDYWHILSLYLNLHQDFVQTQNL